MQFIDFIKSSNTKILIDNNLSDGNSIIKLFSLSNKISISNYEILNINLLAKSLLSSNPEYKYINNEQSTYLFYSFLDNKRDHKNDLYNLIPDSSFSFESVKVCLSTINEIRKGKRIKELNNIDNLIKDYEDYLLSKHYYDDALMLKKCIEIMNIDLIKNVLKLKDKYSIGIVDSYLNSLTYLERSFLDTLVNKLNTSYETLTLFTENNNLSIYSYKTYGFYQEVENVINIINQNKLSVSDVEIIVSDNKYSNSIKAYFDNYKIPYTFSNGISISCFDVYGLIDSIIEFYNNHYSIKCLYDIYRSNALLDEYKNITKLEKLHADRDDILLHASNNYEFNDDQRSFITDLLNLKVSNNVYEIYLRLIKLVTTYTKKELLESLLDTFNNKSKVFELCASLNVDIPPFDVIKRVFENIKIQVKDNKNESIVIRKLSNVNNLIKKHTFILGLSSSQVKLKEVESPLLSDEDISNIIDVDNYYVELASKCNIRLNEKLDRLTKYNSVSNLYLSYSEYDSVEFKVLSPSTYYSKYLNIEENSNIDVSSKLIYKDTTLDEKLIDEIVFRDIKENKKFSPSSLNTLYKCPLQYLYSKYYSSITCNEYDNSWLLGNEKGTFAHKVLQTYYTEHKDKKVDIASLDKIFNDLAVIEKSKHPFDNDNVIKQELDDIYKAVKRVIESNKDSYQVLGCEMNFDKVEVDLLGKKPYIFKGTIDRVDYSKLDGSDELYINIYDYKTSRHKLDLSMDGLTQSFIYEAAVHDMLTKDSSIKSIIGNFDINKVKYRFFYVYLYLYNSKVEIEDKEINKNASIEKLNKFNSLDNSYSSLINVYEPGVGVASDYVTTTCTYCPYHEQCAIKKKYGLDAVWEDK